MPSELGQPKKSDLMKNPMQSVLPYAAFVLILGLSACQDEMVLEEAVPTSETPTSSNSNFSNALVDFRPYFERFEEAAAERGLTFESSLNALETSLEHINDGNVVGECHWNSHAPELVIIDIPFWNNASDLDREYVMFHELGHCVLFRDHDNSINHQGFCLSVMASGTTGCESVYTPANREYYLDELFGIVD